MKKYQGTFYLTAICFLVTLASYSGILAKEQAIQRNIFHSIGSRYATRHSRRTQELLPYITNLAISPITATDHAAKPSKHRRVISYATNPHEAGGLSQQNPKLAPRERGRGKGSDAPPTPPPVGSCRWPQCLQCFLLRGQG